MSVRATEASGHLSGCGKLDNLDHPKSQNFAWRLQTQFFESRITNILLEIALENSEFLAKPT